MSVIRQNNALGQMRFDIPDLRALESSIANDFDVNSGLLTGGNSVIVKGFRLVATNAIGQAATALQLIVQGSSLIHPDATEPGSIFSVPENTNNEILSPSDNPRIIGDWTASAVNFVGIDLVRITDPNSVDTKQFLDADTKLEVSKTVPFSRILEYRIVISSNDFSSQPNILPIAKVTLNSTRNVTVLEDARPLLGRLGNGGDFPDRFSSYSWPEGRQEATSGVNIFAGGDKSFGSLKEWMNGVMSRLWEIGGGPYWYSPTADRNVNLIWNGPAFPTGENFAWDGTNLTWQNLAVVFDNSLGVFTNGITDQVSALPGLTDLLDGDCLYIDLVRTASVTLTPQKSTLLTLGSSAIPGQRMIIAWRVGTRIHTRGWRYPVGTLFQSATQLALGMVRLNAPAASIPDVLNPYVPVLQDSPSTTSLTNGGIALSNTLGHALVGVTTSTTLAAVLGVGVRVGTQGALAGNNIIDYLAVSGLRAGTVGDGRNSLSTGALAGVGAAGVFGFGASGDDAGGFTVTGGSGGFFIGGYTETARGGSGVTSAGGTSTAGPGGHGGTFTAGSGLAGNDGYAVLAKALSGSTAPAIRAEPGASGNISVDAASGRVIQVVTTQDTSDAANKTYVDRFIRQKNYIINGGLDFWQRYSFPSTPFTLTGFSDVRYTADRWVANGGTNYTVDRIPESVEFGPPDHTSVFLRMRRPSGSASAVSRRISQEIDRAFVRELRDRRATISLWIRLGANYSAVVANRVSVFVAAGTSANPNDGWYGTYSGTLSTPASQNFTCSTSWARYEFTFDMPSSMNQLAVVISGDPTGTAGVEDTLDIAGVCLFDAGPQGSGSTTHPEYIHFIRAGGSMAGELELCQRYFEKSGDLDLSPTSTSANAEHAAVIGTGVGATARVASSVRMLTRKRISVGATVNTDLTSVRGTIFWNLAGTVVSNVTIRNVDATITSLFTDESKIVLDLQDAVPSGVVNGDCAQFRWAVDAEIGP